MKRKLILIAVVIALCSVLMAVFAVTVSAEEGITVTYYNQQRISGAKSQVAEPNADGTYTIRDTAFSSGGSITLSTGNVNKEFYGWYDDEGIVYTPGQVVKFTKTTRLYEAYGVTVYNFDDLKTAFASGGYVKLGVDILDAESSVVAGEQNTTVFDLNGTVAITEIADSASGDSRSIFYEIRKESWFSNPNKADGEKVRDWHTPVTPAQPEPEEQN